MSGSDDWGEPEPFGDDAQTEDEADWWKCPNPDCDTLKMHKAQAAAHCADNPDTGADTDDSSESETDGYNDADQYVYVRTRGWEGADRKMPIDKWVKADDAPGSDNPKTCRSLDNPYTLSYEETDKDEPHAIVGLRDGFALDVDIDVGEDHEETFDGDIEDIETPDGALAFLSASGGPHRITKHAAPLDNLSTTAGVDVQGDIQGNMGIVTSPFHHPEYEITNEPDERVTHDTADNDGAPDSAMLNEAFGAELFETPDEPDDDADNDGAEGGSGDETPGFEAGESASGGTENDENDEWLRHQDIAEALSHIPRDLSYDEWMKMAYAVHDYDSTEDGKQLFIDWSENGRKWDSDSRDWVDGFFNAATDNEDTRPDRNKVQLGYLIDKAKLRGWTMPTPAERGALTPWAVEAEAGLDEDESIASLNDRPKAACVWELIERNDAVHIRVRRDNGSLWAYDDGIWKREGERALRHAGRKALGSWNYGANVLSELKVQARGDPRAEVEPDAFGLDTGTVAVENGLVALDMAADGDGDGDDARRDLRPDDLALTQLPVEYDPTAEYDEWASLVEEWAEDGKADALQEYVGYCLHIGALPIHRALLLVGQGANGKGTFLHVVRTLLGEENTSSTELQTLANEKDAVADFYGSLANIDDDLSTRKLGQGKGMFKKLVGGDRVRARRLYEGGFEFDAVGKHLYAANKVPKVDVPDDDEAFWRRWLLVEFPNFYPPDDRDPQLRDDLTDDDTTMSGVLNWAIHGWQRLLDQGHFTNEERQAHDKRRRWQSWGDSVDEFISECVERDDDAPRMTTGEAHARYTAWCAEQDDTDAVKQQPFTVRLKAEDVGYGTSVWIDDESQRGYAALGLSDDVPEADDGDARHADQERL